MAKKRSSSKKTPVKSAAKKVAPAKAAPKPRAGKKPPAALAAKAKANGKPAPAPAEFTDPMLAPPSGVKIRMYRQGHGDCFLLAFRQADGQPYYALIDCGMKKGSTLIPYDKVVRTVPFGCSIQEVAENIQTVTGGHLNLVIITHEHEDHVSGFRSEREVFEGPGLTIDKLWLAWTEDPTDTLARDLRTKYKDTLLGLVGFANQIPAGASRLKQSLDGLLGFELSDEDRALAAKDPEKIKGITNKEAIQIVKKKADAKLGTEYLSPERQQPLTLPNVPGVNVYVLGPPKNELSLKDMDPRGDEEFHLAARAEERSFLAAAGASPAEQESQQPFKRRFREPFQTPPANRSDSWREIGDDWLRSGEQFALRMNTYINNTSLVLAFELPNTDKVLLFVGDAQRGNWVSWLPKTWPVDGKDVSTKDLLGRTVFYKCGHHGSHNATMNSGGLKDMAQGAFADQFVAMIPANQQWALENNKPPWVHPLPEIYKALLKKARGRVLVMDRDVAKPDPRELSDAEWATFQQSVVCNRLYYEFTVAD